MSGEEKKPITATCVEAGCGKEFVISPGEQSFYAAKGMTLPKRCEPCRLKRRAQNAPRSGSESRSDAAGSSQTGPIGDAIATARENGRWNDQHVKRSDWREQRHRGNRRGGTDYDGY